MPEACELILTAARREAHTHLGGGRLGCGKPRSEIHLKTLASGVCVATHPFDFLSTESRRTHATLTLERSEVFLFSLFSLNSGMSSGRGPFSTAMGLWCLFSMTARLIQHRTHSHTSRSQVVQAVAMGQLSRTCGAAMNSRIHSSYVGGRRRRKLAGIRCTKSCRTSCSTLPVMGEWALSSHT